MSVIYTGQWMKTARINHVRTTLQEQFYNNQYSSWLH